MAKSVEDELLSSMLQFNAPAERSAARAFIPTASPALNFALRGGFLRGSINGIVGDTGTGKTTLALLSMLGALKHNPECGALWLDYEQSFPFENAEALGVDLSRVVLVRDAVEGENGLRLIYKLLKELDGKVAGRPIDLIVWDSVAETPWQAEVNAGPYDNVMAIAARKWGTAIKILKGLIARCRTRPAMLVINQYRASMNPYGSPYTEPGGKALQSGYITKIKTVGAAKREGDHLIISISAGKHKFSSKEEDVKVKLLVRDERMQVALGEDLALVGKELGIFTDKSGKPIAGASTWHFNGQPLAAGLANVAQMLEESPELLQEVEAAVLKGVSL